METEEEILKQINKLQKRLEVVISDRKAKEMADAYARACALQKLITHELINVMVPEHTPSRYSHKFCSDDEPTGEDRRRHNSKEHGCNRCALLEYKKAGAPTRFEVTLTVRLKDEE